MIQDLPKISPSLRGSVPTQSGPADEAIPLLRSAHFVAGGLLHAQHTSSPSFAMTEPSRALNN